VGGGVGACCRCVSLVCVVVVVCGVERRGRKRGGMGEDARERKIGDEGELGGGREMCIGGEERRG
jgi:hypothetical protein